MAINKNRLNSLNFFFILIAILTILTGCSTTKSKKSVPREVRLTQTTYARLQDWHHDQHLEALHAFVNSCEAIKNKNPNAPISTLTKIGGNAGQWQAICREARTSKIKTNLEAKHFFEKWFQPYIATDINGSNTGTLTGYYEIELEGSKKPSKVYKYPVYSPPHNINALKGKKSFTHAAINRGMLKGKKLELAWVNNRARLFFLHIQGSGVIKLAEGGEMKVGIIGQNGFKYTSIWPILNEYTQNHGMKSAKIGSAVDMMRWLERNPKIGREIMERNQSYIFFKNRHGKGPIGAQGVVVTPERSLAIDSGLYPYSTPIWVETSLPRTIKYGAIKRYNRLFIAQDRGGAILGPIRGDIFFGRGHRAEEMASHMNGQGKYFILFPKTVKVPAKYRS